MLERRPQPAGGTPGAGPGKLMLALILVCLVIAVFSNTLSSDFTFDDISTIKYNPAIRSPEHAGLYFTQPFFLVGQPERGPVLYDYYRPLVYVSYLVDYSLWGLRPRGWHFTNMVLQTGAALLAFSLFLKLRLGREASFIAAALFAVHPAVADSVAGVSGRTDPLCAVFLLSSLWLYVEARSREGWHALAALLCSSALFALALLSKENAMAVPALLLAYEIIRPNGEEKRKLRFLLPFLAIAAAYMVWRSRIVPASASFSGGVEEFIFRMMTAAEIAGAYFRAGLFPHGLAFETFTPLVGSLADPRALAGVVAAFLAAAGIVLYSRKFPKAGFLSSWFFICLCPFAYFLMFHPGPELFTPPHFLYLPLVGLMGLVGVGLARLARQAGPERKSTNKRTILALAGAVVLLFGAQTMQRNKVWRDDFTFFSAMVERSPRSARVRIGLANSLMERGMPEHALVQYAAARELARSEEPEPLPSGPPPEGERMVGRLRISNYYAAASLAGMGGAYRMMGESHESIRSYERALSESPFDSVIALELARAYGLVGRFDEAIEASERALRIDPGFAAASSVLQIAQEKKKVYEKAADVRRSALRSGMSESSEALYGEAMIARLSGKNRLAEALFREAIDKDPAHFGAHMALGRILCEKGDCGAALGNFGLAFASRPTSPLAAYWLAFGNLAMRDTLAAEQWASRAYDLSPDEYYWGFLEDVRGLRKARKEAQGSAKN